MRFVLLILSIAHCVTENEPLIFNASFVRVIILQGDIVFLKRILIKGFEVSRKMRGYLKSVNQ